MLSKLREEAKQPSKPKPKVPKSKLLDSTKLMGYEMKLPGMKKDLKPIPVFQQQEGEKQRQFFRSQQVTCESPLNSTVKVSAATWLLSQLKSKKLQLLFPDSDNPVPISTRATIIA